MTFTCNLFATNEDNIIGDTIFAFIKWPSVYLRGRLELRFNAVKRNEMREHGHSGGGDYGKSVRRSVGGARPTLSYLLLFDISGVVQHTLISAEPMVG